MPRKFKAVPYIATIVHDVPDEDSEPWEKYLTYTEKLERFCIVSTETGEILDNAQGYGYKTAQKAYKGYGYKTRDKSKDREKRAKEKHIRK